MRRIVFLWFLLGVSLLGTGCRCADGSRPKLFPRLFHRDKDDDDRPCTDSSNRPCNNGFLGDPIAPVSYGPHQGGGFSTMPGSAGMIAGGLYTPEGAYPVGPAGGLFPPQPGSIFPPQTGAEELPRLPPKNVPLEGPNSPNRPADPNNAKLIVPNGQVTGEKK